MVSDVELNSLGNELLSAIEIREARLLNWGFIQSTQTLDWLVDELPNITARLSPRLRVVWERAQVEGITIEDLIANLVDRKLIFESKGRYRTRFAETVRLMYLLRQRFSDTDWQTGARLVSDMKLYLQRRRYPDWNVAVEALLADLEIQTLTDLQYAVLHALTRENGKPLRLARFQAEAIKRQLLSLGSSEDHAIVIGAGTGAGKTKAFYVPALIHIAEALVDKPFVQALALYPRIELLKDQLRETFAEARKLDDCLAKYGKRPICMGAYYSSVPHKAADLLTGRVHDLNWRRARSKDGWVCPYFVCPNPDCRQRDMVWADEDIEREAEDNKKDIYGRFARLRCAGCGHQVGSEHLLLTREQMLLHPPDILFTTTEMLNRRLSHPEQHHLFGIGVDLPPRLVLLDEIHLNESFHGAQVAYLLRRWRYMRGASTEHSLCMVGLSATLTQAEAFFARLTGIARTYVHYISPAEEDLVDEGLEYNVVLRGDPVSGTTLLSTSVRTVMLLGRMLDPLGDPVSGGAWGQRIFAFSDKLDSINRWYHIEREVENPVQPYSRWRYLDRRRDQIQWEPRNLMGQNWWAATLINQDALQTGLMLDLTSSQYRGVDPNADVVIASSTLEVGYNDPKTGAIIQHKAPHTRASFIQRKGRAGRTREMRPWMVVVTSAYGRDRWTFQHAETLFDPTLPPIDLPLENYYVRKIQAVFTLMDWLALRMADTGFVGSLWTLLSNETQDQQHPRYRRARRRLAALLHNVAQNPTERALFTAHLRQTMELEDDDFTIAMLLWGAPRALILDVIPTLLRQLETNWQTVKESGEDTGWEILPWTDQIADTPMPDFLPPTLFSDLNLPEVVLHVPERPSRTGNEPAVRSTEMLGMTLAMLEYAPGKVNKRYADKDRIHEAHWLPVPPDVEDTTIPLESMAVITDIVPHEVTIDETPYRVFRPRVFNLGYVPYDINPTSNAFHLWLSAFEVQSHRYIAGSEQYGQPDGIPIFLDEHSQWREFLPSIKAYTHVKGTWAEVTRLAAQTQVYIRDRYGNQDYSTYDYSAGGEPAALGFTIDVDALHFQVAPLDLEKLKQNGAWDDLYQGFGPRYFHHRLHNDPQLAHLTDFEIDWLWQVELSMIIERAAALTLSLQEAAELVQQNRVYFAQRALSMILLSQPLDTTQTEDNEQNFLHDRLLAHMENSNVQAALAEHVRVLWDDTDPGLDDWLRAVYVRSLGETVFTTLVEMVPDVEADDLHLDVFPKEFWISELTAGGVGLVTKLVDVMTCYPHQFDLQMMNTLRHCERELLASQLNQIVVMLAQDDPGLRADFASIRQTTDLVQIETSRRSLAQTLNDHGIPSTRQLIVAINTKFLRPNSGTDTDKLVATLVKFWHQQQEQLCCEIDIRVIAAVAAQHPDIRAQVSTVLSRIQDTPEGDARVYNLLQSLLWLDCRHSCPDCIEKPHRFAHGVPPSRAMLLSLVETEMPSVTYGARNWIGAAHGLLTEHHRVQIWCAKQELPQCKQDLLHLLATPVDMGDLLLYPVVDQIEQREQHWTICLIVRELVGDAMY